METPPYVKQYDENGILTNPIIDRYDSGKSMRKIKRNKERFVKHKTMTHPNGQPLIFHQFKTNRGKWNTVKII